MNAVICVGGQLDRSRVMPTADHYNGGTLVARAAPRLPKMTSIGRMMKNVVSIKQDTYVLDNCNGVDFFRLSSMTNADAIKKIFGRYEKKKRQLKYKSYVPSYIKGLGINGPSSAQIQKQIDSMVQLQRAADPFTRRYEKIKWQNSTFADAMDAAAYSHVMGVHPYKPSMIIDDVGTPP